ncbi:MAG: hypothetical protein WC091_05630 [Sulfuricellaceae bacterium]
MSLNITLSVRLSTALRFFISSILVCLYIQKDSIAGPFAYVLGGSGILGGRDYAVVYKIDLGNGYKTIKIPLDAMPYGIAMHRNGNLAFLTTRNQVDGDGTKPGDGIGTVVILDTISGKIMKKIETGNSPIGIAINCKNMEFYVGARNSLIVYDLMTYLKKMEYHINGTPFHIVVDKQQRFAWITVIEGSSPIIYSYVLDTHSGSLVEVWPSNFTWDVAVERNSRNVFFSTTSGKVFIWDVNLQKFEKIIDVGQNGYLSYIVASSNSDEVYVSTNTLHLGILKEEIVVLDSNSGAIIRRFNAPSLTTNVNTSEYFPNDLFVVTDTSFEIFNKESGIIKHAVHNLTNNGYFGYVQVPFWVGNFVPDAPKDKIDSDRLFNWAEDKYPKIFSSPQRPFSKTADGYYFRYYSGTATYLGTKGGNVFYLPAGAGMNEIIDLGPMDKFLPNADADGY